MRKVGLPAGFENMITKKLTRAQNIKLKRTDRQLQLKKTEIEKIEMAANNVISILKSKGYGLGIISVMRASSDSNFKKSITEVQSYKNLAKDIGLFKDTQIMKLIWIHKLTLLNKNKKVLTDIENTVINV